MKSYFVSWLEYGSPENVALRNSTIMGLAKKIDRKWQKQEQLLLKMLTELVQLLQFYAGVSKTAKLLCLFFHILFLCVCFFCGEIYFFSCCT